MPARYAVRALLPTSEHASVPVGYVAEILNRPGTTVRAATLSRRKDLQRQILRAFRPPFAATVRSGPIGPPPPPEVFPLIVKPAGLSGSRGIKVVTGPDEWRALPVESQDRIAESFVPGPEYSVEAVFAETRLRFAGVARKTVNATFAEVGHLAGPDVLAGTDRRRLIKAAERVAAVAGLQTGFLHAEFKLADGGPQLIEFAVRPPGDALVQLHSLTIGQPLEDVMLAAHLQEPTQTPEVKAAAAQVYLRQDTTGPLRAVVSGATACPVVYLGDGEPWPSAPTWHDHCIIGLVHVRRGSPVTRVETNFERIASVVAHASDSSALPGPDELGAALRIEVNLTS
ncbi:MAG: ATP-grasp domain-containing protein [Acetobacteraceae bacterium]|nr:ATP-grasp domain-containing protein [Acetobacteraceae bacterium]